MRRRNRTIEIFSISALDLFASALGAFILVTMILFPYYGQGRTMAARLDAADADLAGSKAHAAELQARLDAATAALKAQGAAASAGAAFLLVQMRWAAPAADVDLHVTDPDGHDFFWYKPNTDGRDYPGSRAELSYDMTAGPAFELWQDPSPSPGTYRVDYVANALPEGETVEVAGTLFDRAGPHALPARLLRRAKERVHAATVTVEGDGRVAIR